MITTPARRAVGIDLRELPSADEAHALAGAPLPELLARAQALREQGTGRVVTFSPKVFVPLTTLCRDVCHYCTFARPPRRGERAYMTREEVLAVARAGAATGCHEALFTLGDKPERRYKVARDELAALGHETTISYLAEMAGAVLAETGLLPHVNPGVLDERDLLALRAVSPSQGIMLESVSPRLMERGMPHHGSPDKHPAARLATLAAAGRAAVPFTTGILIGIGETRAERIEALLTIRDLHARHGHIQEVIVQNFRAKPDTRMRDHAEPDMDELLWTAAVARVLLGPTMNLQVPPNLSYDDFPRLLEAGINDWGGVSPVTIDHVNPEAPWPELERLRDATEAAGFQLAPRLPLYPEYLGELERWCDPAVRAAVLRRADASGLAREGDWASGATMDVPPALADLAAAPPARRNGGGRCPDPRVADVLARQRSGATLGEDDIVGLFGARGRSLRAVLEAADALRREVNGDTVTYVVTRNINYTNVCYFRCGFCAFSKGKLAEALRGKPYLVPTDEIVRRCHEAWERGAVEVCLQGGIHPGFTGDYYSEVLRAIKAALPSLHVHAFSALEVWQGAATLGVPLDDYLRRLRREGLGSLPGTAAEVLDDEVRAVLCPDKVNTDQWLSVHESAHRAGLRSTTTIMFGAVEWTHHWARHLIRLRDLQARTGGFTEFVPLPFVHMEAPIYLRGGARPGPTLREGLLMHAVARLALHPHITNIQTSWVKMGIEGAKACLNAGANDLGGTLMNESISRAAGASHGQEMPPEAMEETILAIGRRPLQRNTVYGTPDPERVRLSFGAPALVEPLNPHFNDTRLERPARLVRPGLVGAGR